MNAAFLFNSKYYKVEQIKRWELVELTVPALSQGRVTFNTIPQLRNQPDQIIVIKDIDVFPVTVYSNSQQSAAIPGMPVADVKKAVLVLYVNGEESIKMIPLAKLIHVNDFSTAYQENVFGLDSLTNVDFDKSYVQFSVASNAAAYVIPFGITYVRLVKSSTGMPSNTSAPAGNWQQG
jgi:hypothetical protein